MKPKCFRTLASTLLFISFSGATHAAVITKADNADALGLASSWGGTAPGAADIANWSGTYHTAGSLAAPLPGSALSWQGITVGSLTGGAAGTVSIGGAGAPVAASNLALGASGISLASASHDLVINAETLTLAGSQTWTIPAGRNLRIGANVATANVDGPGGDATVITITGGGTVDANQGAANGFADHTGKWIVGPGTMLRGIGTGTAAWGSNTAADAITLNGGTLAYGAIGGAAPKVAWPSPITLGTATISAISGQHLGTGTPELTLQGGISGDGSLTIDKAAGTPFILRIDRADNSYTGWTSINAGASGSIAVFAHLGTGAGLKSPFGSGDITVTGASATGAALECTTDAVSTPSNAVSVIANNINLNNATLRTREGLYSFTGTLYLTGANVIQGQVDLKDITIEGLIDGPGSVQFRAIGSQQITLPAANTYTGGTILGSGTSNAGAILLGDPGALGSGPVTARGLQIRSDVPDLVLTNAILVGGGAGGGLCFGGANNISLTGAITVNDNSSRQFQNSGTGVVTLADIAINAGASSTAVFGSTTARGEIVVAGPITGQGKVTISGGKVTLAGASTYTGTTTVSSLGQLNLTGTLASAITLSGANASITGSGSTSGNLTTSGANGAGIFYVDPSNPTTAITAADVSINGPTKVELLSQQQLGSTTYTVLNYGGTFTGLANLASSQTRGVFANDTINKRITFAATTATRTWTGAATATWNATDLNWAEDDKRFYAGDAAVFGNTGAGELTIAGVVSPSLATFSNSSGNDYTLVSAANNQIGGPGGLLKSGTGTVTLVGPNTFTGTTTLTAGTLAIRADNSLGTPPAELAPGQLTLTGGTLKLEPASPGDFTLHQNRGITLAAGDATIDTTAVGNNFTANIAGEVEGAGNLVLLANGDTSLTGGGAPGATVLTGANLQTGSSTIKSGVVTVESGFGDFDSIVILDGGGLVDRGLNASFSQPLQVGPAGGILRTYNNTTTTFASPIGNALGVTSATLTHTDGGTQIFTGDGSAFTGTYINARGSAFFDTENWQGMDLVNVDGEVVRFRSGMPTTVKSLTTDRDVHIEAGTILDVLTGMVTVAPGTASQNFWIQNEGVLTSSSGTLTFDFQTPFTAPGADDQAVRVRVEDYDGATPLTVVKNGPGSLNSFDQPNTYTGGTIVNAGRINVADSLALGFGAATVKPGAQLFLSQAGGTYYNDALIEGNGPTEPAGNLGALRLANCTLDGKLTVAPAGARIVAYLGTTGTIAGELLGSGPLELNSSTSGHNGTLVLAADGSAHTGPITVAQGTLDLIGTAGGNVTLATGATLAGEGLVNGTLILGDSVLRVNGSTPEALTVETLTTGGTIQVRLDSLPDPLEPITVIDYTTFSGSVPDFTNSAASLRRLAFSDDGSAIIGTVDSGTRTWAGTASGLWDSSALNWVEGDKRFFTGDTVVFSDDATTKTVTIPGPVRPASVTVTNTAGNNYTITGQMITPVDGTLVKDGAGELTLAGTPSNLGGELIIDGGRVTFATTDYQRPVGPACPGIVVNDTGILRINTINPLYDGAGNTPVTVNAGGVVELNAYHSHFRELNLNGGTIIGIRPDGDGSRYNNEYSTFDNPVIVGGSQRSTITRQAGTNGTYSLAGAATFEVGDATAGMDLLVSAPLIGNGLIKNGPGTMALAIGCSYGGVTTVNGGTLLANNPAGSATSTGAVTVKSGATVGGTGAIIGTLTLESGATLAPGDAGVESLATGPLTLPAGTILTAEINSSGTPASDVVAVTGTVSLGGSLQLADIATTPAVVPGGTKLTLLTYSDTLIGRFSNYAEGATVPLGVNSFKIRYNDAKKITLESLAAVTGYAEWAASKITNGQIGRNQDADLDGFTNLHEFLFGTEPMIYTGSLTTSEIVGNSLILRWLQRESGAAYTLKESVTLAAGSWATSALVPARDPNQAGVPTNYDRYRVTIPLGAVSEKFFRVEGVEN